MRWVNAGAAALTAAGRKGHSLSAAGVAFYMLLSLFPAAVVVISVIGLVIDPVAIQPLIEQLRPLAPALVVETFQNVVAATLAAGEARLSTTALISFAIAIWSAGAAVRALLTALQIAFPTAHAYGVLASFALSILFTVTAVLVVVIVVGVMVALPIAFHALRALEPPAWIDPGWDATWTLLQQLEPVILIGFATAMLSAIYWLGAARRTDQLKNAALAALITTLIWLAASRLLGWYFATFADLNAVYGPFGAVAGLMLWFWASAFLVLLGAELTAALAAVDRRAAAPPPTETAP